MARYLPIAEHGLIGDLHTIALLPQHPLEHPKPRSRGPSCDAAGRAVV